MDPQKPAVPQIPDQQKLSIIYHKLVEIQKTNPSQYMNDPQYQTLLKYQNQIREQLIRQQQAMQQQQMMMPQAQVQVPQQPPPKQTKRFRADVKTIPMERDAFIKTHDEIQYDYLRAAMDRFVIRNPLFHRMRINDAASMAVYQALYLYVRKFAQKAVKAAKRRRNDNPYKEKNFPPNSIPLYRFSLLAAERRALESGLVIRDTRQQMPLEVIGGIAARKVGTDREELLPLTEKPENDLILQPNEQLEGLPSVNRDPRITLSDLFFVVRNDPTFDRERLTMYRMRETMRRLDRASKTASNPNPTQNPAQVV